MVLQIERDTIDHGVVVPYYLVMHSEWPSKRTNSIEGWWWARRDTRWDPYPQNEPLVRLRVESDGPHFVKMFHESGVKVCEGYILVRPVSLSEQP